MCAQEKFGVFDEYLLLYSPTPPNVPFLSPPSSFSCSPSAANLLLQDTVERIHVGRQYGDIPRGIYLVRGENVALCGEIVSLLLLAACPIVQFRQSCNKVLALEETVVKVLYQD